MIKNLGIIGAGNLGYLIARHAALAKISVSLYDVNETILRRTIEQIKADIRKAVNLGKIPQEEFSKIMERIRTKTNLPDLSNCDYIIESTIEDLQVKQDLFKQLDLNTKSSTIIASATTIFSITSIASTIRNPERTIGIHFLNTFEPRSIVEIISGHRTNPATIEQTKALMNSLGKNFVIVKDVPGFISNRMLNVFFSEALQLLDNNIAQVPQIDRIVKTIGGFTTGPFETMDQIGIDAIFNKSKVIFEQSFYDSRFKPNLLLKQMLESGIIGKKTGNGFYAYEMK